MPHNIAPASEWTAREGVDFIAAADKGVEAMTADEAGSTCDENALHETKSG
jgi:hypothetical protein